MKYREIIFTFKEIPESDKQYLINSSINDYQCLGVEELNLDCSNDTFEDWQLHASHLDEFIIDKKDNSLKFFFDFTNTKFTDFIKDTKGHWQDSILDMKTHEGDDDDWKNEWQKFLTPIKVNNNLTVEFLTDDKTLKNVEKDRLFIYPGMGFGTGGHETTYLCLQILDKLFADQKFNSGLDFGCGSGILGILLNKRGVQKVCFYDIDEDALINCQQNIDLNADNSKNLKITHKKSEIGPAYDLVVANILLNILISEEKTIMSKVEDYLLLSGVLENQKEDLLQVYVEKNKMQLIEVKQKNEWLAILLKRNK